MKLGPRIPSAKDRTDAQISGAVNSAEKWLKNTLEPTVDPVEAAIKAKPRFNAGVQKAIAEDRFVKGLRNVDRSEVEQTLRQGGASKFSTGIQSRAAKILRRNEESQGLLEAHVQKMDQMPVDTPEQREAKMIANKRGMEALGVQLRG